MNGKSTGRADTRTKIFNVLLFDIKGFSLFSEEEQRTIVSKLRDWLNAQFSSRPSRPITMFTGDGYYICEEDNANSYGRMLRLIADLGMVMEDTAQIRFALTVGPLRETQDVNGQPVMEGPPLIELKRILDEIRAGDVVYLSKAFFRKYVSGRSVVLKQVSKDMKLFVIKEVTITDKHGDSHTAYNVTIILNESEFGNEDREYGATSKLDAITVESVKTIIKVAFNDKPFQLISDIKIAKHKIDYSYLSVDVTHNTQEYFLFLNNSISKKPTISHFVQNNSVQFPLNIFVNRIYIDNDRNEFWKADFIAKFSEACKIKHAKFTFYFLDEFIWDYCLPKALKEFDPLTIEKNYISPDYSVVQADKTPIDARDKTIEGFMTEWINGNQSPLLLLLGTGGMGKTTVLRRFGDMLNENRDNNKIAFYVNAHQITERINRQEDIQLFNVKSLGDLITFYFGTVSYQRGISVLLDEDLIGLMISSGNVVIIIDGIDEVSAALKEKFDMESFLKNIMNINNLLNHSKIVIATRDYYWNRELSAISRKLALVQDMNVIRLNGFTYEMAETYFQKIFARDQTKTEAALEMLFQLLFSHEKPDSKSHTAEENTKHYWPFVAFLVADIIRKQDQLVPPPPFNSKYLDGSIRFDTIIFNICGRESERQVLDLTVDEILDIFREIIFDSQGHMPMNVFDEYLRVLHPSLFVNSSNPEIKILNNPFLQIQDNMISIGYDFVQNHLIAVFLSHYILNKVHSRVICRVLARYYDGKNDILKEIRRRMQKDQDHIGRFESFFKGAIEILRKTKVQFATERSAEKTVSTLLYLAFEIFPEFGKTMMDRTALIKRLYANDLNNIHIYGNFFPLDFSGLILTNCSFNNYYSFTRSRFDDNTKIKDSIINIPLESITGNMNITNKIFDNCYFSDRFKLFIQNSEGIQTTFAESVRKDLRTLLKRFYENARLSRKKETDLQFSSASPIDSRKLLKVLYERNIITDKEAQPPYNVSVTKAAAEAVYHLVYDNYSDSTMDNLLSYIIDNYRKT